MEIMSESQKYQIINEYENVYLKIKKTLQQIFIGDFYGDPELAIISPNEEYCVIAGTGIIVYYLKEPFLEYKYTESAQWKEWGRKDKKSTIYVRDVSLLDDNRIEIETENGEKVIIDVY